MIGGGAGEPWFPAIISNNKCIKWEKDRLHLARDQIFRQI